MMKLNFSIDYILGNSDRKERSSERTTLKDTCKKRYCRPTPSKVGQHTVEWKAPPIDAFSQRHPYPSPPRWQSTEPPRVPLLHCPPNPTFLNPSTLTPPSSIYPSMRLPYQGSTSPERNSVYCNDSHLFSSGSSPSFEGPSSSDSDGASCTSEDGEHEPTTPRRNNPEESSRKLD